MLAYYQVPGPTSSRDPPPWRPCTVEQLLEPWGHGVVSLTLTIKSASWSWGGRGLEMG